MCVGFFCEFGFAMEAVSEATEATVAGECYFGRRETLFGESVLLGGRTSLLEWWKRRFGMCTCTNNVPVAAARGASGRWRVMGGVLARIIAASSWLLARCRRAT